jgi:hypothetical protein
MTARTVLHGVDTSAPNFAKLPAVGNQGSECYTDDLRARLVYDDAAGKWLPQEYIPFVYDFAVHGGAVGAIDLGISVPAGTIILDGIYDVVDALASGGAATIALKVEGTGDVLAAAAIGTAGTEGLHDVVPDGTAAKAIKATEDRKVTLTVAVAALTAGKLYGFLRCVRGPLVPAA